MRVLITGGAGFIGSHLADAHVARGDEVFIIDDLSTGSVDNVEHLIGHPRFHHTIGAVQNRPVTAELVDRADVIYHLAAAVGVRLIIESPVRTIETNLTSTECVLSLAAKKRKRVLFTSTSEVYGLSTEIPFREDGHLVLGATTTGRWSYAATKAIDEFLALAYCHERRLPVVVARLFNTVGPRQTGAYGMVVPTMVGQALAGEPLTVFGDGSQSRCFAYVGDVVAALMKLVVHSEAPGAVFNVGSTDEISVLDLARRVKALTRSQSPIRFIPYDEAYDVGFEDMPRRVPDLSKVHALIGYRHSTPLDDILGAVIDDQRSKARGAAPEATRRAAS